MPESISIHGMTLNKGEWAELYTMLKLLGEGKMYTADRLLRKNLDNYLDVMKVIREEIETNVLEYVIDRDQGTVSVIEKATGRVLAVATMDEFNRTADLLFADMQTKSGPSIVAPEKVCDFAKIIFVGKPKAPAVRALSQQFGGKNDIIIEVRDSQTSIVSVMGFSIKSRFAAAPTLFNAGSSSQFLFKISNCTDDRMAVFNAISDGNKRGWSTCKRYLKEYAMDLEYVSTSKPVYTDNMVLIRDTMPQIMAWCVKDRLVDSDSAYGVKETTERLIAANPLHVGNPQALYEKVIKDFLMASFTGMTAGRSWDGREQVNGGYIVVMEDGDVLCYHSSDRESFRDYLYRNTHFEYVGTGKYNWGYIIKRDQDYYLPLNMSIRFNTDTR